VLPCCLGAGDHGSTFAGAPLACAAGNATLDIIMEPGFLDSVQTKGAYLRGELAEALKGVPHVTEIRGNGLICGVELNCPAGPVTKACMDAGLIVITAGAGNVVRLVPPLVITEADIDKCVSILSTAIKAL